MTPTDESQLAELIATAVSPLKIRGGDTRHISGVLGEKFTTAGLSGVTLYEPGALTLVAKAGTPVREIISILAKEGQQLAFEPMDYRGMMGSDGTPTIGGVVATNNSGPRRIQVGACRDFLLGVRFVDGTGRVIKNGGRVMKNVTGYDLSKLMAGSYGTLGVLTEVSLKVLPTAETSASIVLTGLSDADAVLAMTAALCSPYDVSGAAHFAGNDARTAIRLEGFENSVSYRVGELSKTLSGFGDCQTIEEKKSIAIWNEVRNVQPFHQITGDVWRISVKPSDGPAIAARLNANSVIYDWGGGLIWALLDPGTDARAQIANFDGHATLVRATENTRRAIPTFQPQPKPLAKISEGIRNKYDPRGILNPGLMG